MLTIQIPELELFDEETAKFSIAEAQTLVLEHSLVSLSKWESKWEKPFLSHERKTLEETYGYISCMGVGEDIPEELVQRISEDQFQEINDYIEKKMTATWFTNLPASQSSRETITAEIIYYWMIALQIPTEYEIWHLNKLFTLIKVVNEKNKPTKKMDRKTAASEQRRINELRRQQYASNG